MSWNDEDRDDNPLKGCPGAGKAISQLILIIISIVRACTLYAPDSVDLIVGVESHTKDSNLVTWYCQDDTGRFWNCTSNNDITLAKKLPPVAAVASNRGGDLILTFKLDDGYWRGDLSGPQEKLAWIEPSVDVVDNATNGDAETLHGLCKTKNRPAHDCFANPIVDYPVADDQRLVGLTLKDSSSARPILYCAVADDGSYLVEECDLTN